MLSVGYLTGSGVDPERPAWDGTGGRPLAWSAWYPSFGGGALVPGQMFDMGDVHLEAPLAAGSHPVVLLSHGTGGSPESLGWLASFLAQHGFVVVGAHHHGNTGREPYRAEGFLCWWERATDLSVLLSRLTEAGPFAGGLDMTRVHALGFSLGGHTGLALAGARSSMERYMAWAKGTRFAMGPRELPDAAQDLERLRASSEAFRASWARQGECFHDPRVKSVVALAPAPPVRAFDSGSLGAIDMPVTLITGGADTEAPTADCAAWLVAQNPRFQHHNMGAQVGHYTFLGQAAGDMPEGAAFLFENHPDVDRDAVHRAVAQITLDALA